MFVKNHRKADERQTVFNQKIETLRKVGAKGKKE
jgi:hypothetical protein